MRLALLATPRKSSVRNEGHPLTQKEAPCARARILGKADMGQLSYMLVWMFAAVASEHPGVAIGALVTFLLRDYLPDPWVFLRTSQRIARLKESIRQNPANTTARRDLARLWILRRRFRRAEEILTEALVRHPDDAELLYLLSLARFQAGRHEEALGPLVRATEQSPSLLFGEPYLLAGRALSALGRHAEAEDAFERLLRFNSSSMDGYAGVAQARLRQGQTEGAKTALREAGNTWRALPGFKRRVEWAGYLRVLSLELLGTAPF